MKFLTLFSIIICFLVCSCANGESVTPTTLPLVTDSPSNSPVVSGIKLLPETTAPTKAATPEVKPTLSNTPTPKEDVRGEDNMTTYYVSNSTANGYVVGNNGNTGLDKTHPKLTFVGALGAVSGGDTIVLNDGIYPEGNYFYMYHPITVLGETDYGATIQISGGSYGAIVQPSEQGTYTFGKIILDGGNAAPYFLKCYNAAFLWGITLNNTHIQGFIDNVIDANPVTLFNLTMINCIVDCQSTENGNNRLIIDEGMKQGAINISGCTFTHGTVGTTAQKTLSFQRASAYTGAVTVSINNNIFVNNTGLPGGDACIKIVNIANAVVSGNTITVNDKVPGNNGFLANIIIGSSVSADPANYNGNNPVIQNNICHNNTSGGGYIICVGIDSSVPDNTYGFLNNNAIISGNTAIGSAAGIAANIHAIMVGNETGCQVYNNNVSYAGIGLLAKGVTGGTYSYNIVSKCTTYLYSRACNGTAFYNNTLIISTGYNEYALKIDTYTGTISTGVLFKNNLVYAKNASLSYFVNSDATSNATFANNLYYGTSIVGWLYGGSTYSTFSSWVSAKESSAISSDPLLSNLAGGDYRLTFPSPAIKNGVNVGLTKDFAGNNVGAVPCIGAYEYNKAAVLSAMGII